MLNFLALLNIFEKSVTLEVSQLFRGLLNYSAERNIEFMFSKFDVFHFPMYLLKRVALKRGGVFMAHATKSSDRGRIPRVKILVKSTNGPKHAFECGDARRVPVQKWIIKSLVGPAQIRTITNLW